MSDEALEEEANEQDIISLIAKQGEEDEDSTVDEEEVSKPSTLEEALEVIDSMKEKVSKKNKTIRKRTEANHRIQAENEAIMKRLEAIESNQQQSAGSGRENSGIDVQEWKDRYEDDQSSIFDYINQVQEDRDSRYAEFLQAEFEKIHGMIGGLQSATDPERAKYSEQIEILRQSPQFADLDDISLIAVAKAMSGVKVPVRGSIAGKRAVRTKERKPNYGGLSKEDVLKRMGFRTTEK